MKNFWGQKKFQQRISFWDKRLKFFKNLGQNNISSLPKNLNFLKLQKGSYDQNFFFLKKNWIWNLTLGVFFLFFGFFSATSAITIIGSVADWDPLAAAVLLCWIELFTKFFYGSQKSTNFFRFLNTFKIGIVFGMFVDAFKLTG